MRPTALVSSVAFLCLGVATAQTTHLVGPGGFAQIRDAVAIAAPGDVIVVQPGTYAHFTAPVPCTIRAAVPGTAEVRVDAAFVTCPGGNCLFAGVTVLAPPAGSSMRVVGLRFRPDSVFFGGSPVFAGVAVQGGTVSFEDCSFGVQGSSTLITALYVDHAVAHLLRCTVDGYPLLSVSHTMRVVGADVTLVDCTIRTNPGALGGTGLALEAIQSRVHGSRVDLHGIGNPALRCQDSAVWLSDSTIDDTQTSACAVAVVSGALPQLDRCVVTNPPGASCASFPPATFLLGAHQAQPVQNGAVLPLDFRCEANGLVAVLATTEPGAFSAVGVLAQPLWLDPANTFVAALVVADALGQATVPIAVPAGAQFVDRALWFQGVSGAVLPLQLGPVMGGVVR